MTGHATSAFGNAISVTALPLLVLQLTGSGLRMGLVAMLQMLPMLAFGLFAGALADRWDRRRTMIWCDVGRAILVGCIPASALLGIPTMWVLYAVVVPIGLLWVQFEATSLAGIPALVGRARLAEANAHLSIAASIGYVLGPGLAGVLVASIGAAYTLGVDALTFAFSAACLLAIRRPLQAEHAPTTEPIGARIREGIQFIVRHRVLRAVLAYWAAVSFLTAPLVVCVTFYLTKELAMTERALGLVISAYAAGAALGALVSTRVRGAPAGYAILIGTVLGGLAIIALGTTERLWLAMAIALVAGASESLAIVFYTTLRAQVTPDRLLGRVISVARLLTFGLQPLSLLLAGVLLDLIGGTATLWLIGGLPLAISVVFWLLGGARLVVMATGDTRA